MARRVLLIDGVVGIYVPNRFYNNFDFLQWNLDQSNYHELSDPYHEGYWDAWDDLLREAFHVDLKGRRWLLEQCDGDLFASPQKREQPAQ